MEHLQPLFDWIAAHPEAALGLLAFAAFFDALLLIGFLLPSYLVLLGIGALIALDALSLWPAVLATAAGAALGDAFNYWLGQRYLDRLTAHRRMARFRQTVMRTRAFFHRRGGLALVASRLFGPTRPVGPMIAGAAPMPPLRFAAWTVFSCLLWALVFILPGVALGASLQLAAEVATRLVLVLIGLIALIGGITWVTTVLVRFSTFHAERWLQDLMAWSAHHRRLGLLPRWLADPRYPETPALLLIALLLLAVGWTGLQLSWGPARDAPMALDVAVYRQMAALQTPWAVDIAAAIAHLGDLTVVLTTSTALVITLFALRRGRAAAHVLAALGFAGIISLGLSRGLQAADPADFFAGATTRAYSGADLILTCALFGLLPLLLARPGGTPLSLFYYRIAFTMPALIAAAQLYVGRQWASVAIGCLVLGGLWMLALGIGYRRHRRQTVLARRLLPPVVMSFVAAAVVLWPENLRQTAPLPDAQPVAHAQWWAAGLPSELLDPAQRSPFDRLRIQLQWRASEAARDRVLREAGWVPTTPWSSASALRTLSMRTPITQLPLPPRQYGLRLPEAMFQRPGKQADRLVVLYLWRAPATVAQQPVWLGSLQFVTTRRLLGVIRVPYTEGEAPSAERWLGALPDTQLRRIAGAAGSRSDTDPPLLLHTTSLEP
ncbi:VTT domain-containing protein [Algiphilus sp.]|uniref:VTT domain-containing protein n=1 Tax=Algiphilus sp. TaxID=1872431 RepID=UPI0032EF8672